MKRIITATLLTILASTTVFAQKGRANIKDFENNIVRISPLTQIDNGTGYGISYERLFGQKGIIGVQIPFYYVLEDNENWNFGPKYTENNKLVFFAPSLKIYPFGQGKINYAVGPTLFFGYGKGKEIRTINTTVINKELYEKTFSKVGFMVKNYLDYQITQGFILSFEGGLGIKYIDDIEYNTESKLLTNYTQKKGFGIAWHAQIAFGYRF